VTASQKGDAELAAVEGLLAYPLPFPAGWIADPLARFDRSFRYAMRSVERREPVVALYVRHARLPPLRQGFVIETFEGRLRIRGAALPAVIGARTAKAA
jgi:hypothetical protein